MRDEAAAVDRARAGPRRAAPPRLAPCTAPQPRADAARRTVRRGPTCRRCSHACFQSSPPRPLLPPPWPLGPSSAVAAVVAAMAAVVARPTWCVVSGLVVRRRRLVAPRGRRGRGSRLRRRVPRVRRRRGRRGGRGETARSSLADRPARSCASGCTRTWLDGLGAAWLGVTGAAAAWTRWLAAGSRQRPGAARRLVSSPRASDRDRGGDLGVVCCCMADSHRPRPAKRCANARVITWESPVRTRRLRCARDAPIDPRACCSSRTRRRSPSRSGRARARGLRAGGRGAPRPRRSRAPSGRARPRAARPDAARRRRPRRLPRAAPDLETSRSSC